MEDILLEILSEEKNKEKESKFGLMVESMKGFGLTTREMEMESIQMRMAENLIRNMRMAS